MELPCFRQLTDILWFQDFFIRSAHHRVDHGQTYFPQRSDMPGKKLSPYRVERTENFIYFICI